MRTDFDTLKITVFVKDHPSGGSDVVYTDLYVTREYVGHSTFEDVMKAVTKAAEKVMRKRLIE